MTERTFDWRPNPDPRNASFLAAAGVESARRARYWRTHGPTLNQGKEGACTGHGVTNAIITSPLSLRLPDPQITAFGLYYTARFLDEWPGEDYSGSSVKAACQAAQSMGLIGSYWWVRSVAEMANAILESGPVVIGVPWFDSMYDTHEDGLVTVRGSVVGGHCLLVTGYSKAVRTFDGYIGPVFRWRNSWGEDYGHNGNAYVSYEDMERLFTGEGDMQGEGAVVSPVSPPAVRSATLERVTFAGV